MPLALGCCWAVLSCRRVPPTRSAIFLCPAGARIEARYTADHVMLRLPGAEAALPIARSASGARYANDTLEVWEHAGAVHLSRRGSVLYDNCRLAR